MDELTSCENKHCNVSYNACPELMEWYEYRFSKGLCYDCYLDLCIKDLGHLKPVFKILNNGIIINGKVFDRDDKVYNHKLLLKMIEDTIF